MPVLGLTFFIYGLLSTHYSLTMKHMDFRSRTVADMADAITRGVVGVSLALAGAGVWALVAGYVAGNVAMAIAVWWRVPWRPHFRPQRKHLRLLLGFGGADDGDWHQRSVSRPVRQPRGRPRARITQLGYYSIATALPGVFIISLAMVAGEVLFPAFAEVKSDERGRAFVTALQYMAMVVLPLTAILIVLAEPITLAVFGPHWRPAIAPGRVLCLWAAMSPISMVCGNLLKAHGRANTVLLLGIPQAIAIIVGSLLLAPHGIVAVSWLQAGCRGPCADGHDRDHATGLLDSDAACRRRPERPVARARADWRSRCSGFTRQSRRHGPRSSSGES